jgi:hypothetical protein
VALKIIVVKVNCDFGSGRCRSTFVVVRMSGGDG